MPDVLCLYGLSLDADMLSSWLFVHHCDVPGCMVAICTLLLYLEGSSGARPELAPTIEFAVVVPLSGAGSTGESLERGFLCDVSFSAGEAVGG